MDILDLDWHCGPVDVGYTLASASVDNHIMVWHVHPPTNIAPSLVPSYGNSASSTLISPKRILSGHDSFVKGLSYDPVGRYLLSSGSDNRIIVWDVENDYSILKVLDEPLRNAPDKTIFRRISWSPDGQSVCVTSAQKSSKPIGMVLKRGTWESVADLVGHTSSSISAKFCTHVLQQGVQSGANNKHSAAAAVSCAVALGDQNGVLSVWSTHSNRPMYVLRDACDGAITDVAWARGAAQTALVFCGIDGTVVIADFENELGRALNPAALEKHFQALYGRNMNELQQRPQALIENTLALKYALPTAAPMPNSGGNGAIHAPNVQKNGNFSTNGASPMSSFANRGANNITNSVGGVPLQQAAPHASQGTTSQGSSSLQMQQETVIINGKKRIRPVLMQNNLDTPSEVTSAALPSAPNLNGPPSQQQQRISPAPAPASSSNGFAFGSSGGFDDFGGMDTGDDLTAFKRGRVDPPVLLHSQSAPQMPGVLRQGNISQAANGNSSRNVLMPPPVGGTAAAASAPARAPTVERVMTIRFENDETVCTVPLLGHQQVLRKAVKPAPPTKTPSSGSPASAEPAATGLGSLVLDPSIYSNSAKSSATSHMSAPNFLLTATRLTKPALLAQLRHSGGKLSAITLSSAQASMAAIGEGSAAVGGGLWTAVVAGEVTCIAAAEFGAPSPSHTRDSNCTATDRLSGLQKGLCLIGCNDGTMHCIGLGCGARVGPPIVLGAALAYVDITPAATHSSAAVTYLALVVTAEGEVWKWEVSAQTAKFRCVVRTNLRPVLLSMKCRSSASAQGSSGVAGANTNEHVKDRKTVSLAGSSSSTKGGASTDAAGTSSTASGGASSAKKSDGVSVRIEQCILSEAGEIVVHLMSATGGTEGGDWQAFSYSEDAMVWTRLADMRYVLSRYANYFLIVFGKTTRRDLAIEYNHQCILFAALHNLTIFVSFNLSLSCFCSLFSVKALGVTAGGAHGHQISTDSLPGTNMSDPSQSSTSATSLTALQTLAATGAKFGTKDIICIAAAKQASSYSLNLSMGSASAMETLGSVQDITLAVGSSATGVSGVIVDGGSGGKRAPSVEDWSNLVTVSHVEVSFSILYRSSCCYPFAKNQFWHYKNATAGTFSNICLLSSLVCACFARTD